MIIHNSSNMTPTPANTNAQSPTLTKYPNLTNTAPEKKSGTYFDRFWITLMFFVVFFMFWFFNGIFKLRSSTLEKYPELVFNKFQDLWISALVVVLIACTRKLWIVTLKSTFDYK